MSKKPDHTRPDDATNEAKIPFEIAYRELENIVAQLEQGDLPLERALELHERGQQLAALCLSQLEQAELRVRKLEINN